MLIGNGNRFLCRMESTKDWLGEIKERLYFIKNRGKGLHHGSSLAEKRKFILVFLQYRDVIYTPYALQIRSIWDW